MDKKKTGNVIREARIKKNYTQSELGDTAFYANIVYTVEDYCRKNYVKIINKNIVKTMIDNIRNEFPGVVDGLIPEQISYLKVEKKLKELLVEGKTIRDLIHILEELEEECFG